jgi:hypothetical protein
MRKRSYVRLCMPLGFRAKNYHAGCHKRELHSISNAATRQQLALQMSARVRWDRRRHYVNV